MSAVKFRVIPMTIDETGDNESTVISVVRHAFDEDAVHFWAVQEKEDGRWYTVDDFPSYEDAKELLQQLIEGEESEA